jgi:hypothetical protein
MDSPIINLISEYAVSPRRLALNIAWRLPRTISDQSYIFVVGCPRSGTTLLQRILAVHPRLCSYNGETNLFSYRELFRRNYFGFARVQLQSLHADSADIVDFFDRSVSLFKRQELGIDNARIFVEKTPQHILKIKFLLRHFPNSRFIHILRDGRDAYVSSKEHPGISQNISPVVFARYWKRCLDKWASVDDHKSLFQVKYEDLAANPERSLAALLSSLGLEYHQNMFQPSAISADPRSSKFVFRKLNEPINSSSVGRWKSEMSPAEINEFHRIALKSLVANGYSASLGC